MHPNQIVMGIIAMQLARPSRHTRFAPARRGRLPGILKSPCSIEQAQTLCLAGMIKYARMEAARRIGETSLADAAIERVTDLFEQEAKALGYSSIQTMNDWGGYRMVCAAARSVEQRV